MRRTATPNSTWLGALGGLLLLTTLAGCAPPVRPMPFEPVAAWWHYFPDLSEGEWDYFTQHNNVREPILAQLRPSAVPLTYRMEPNNESAVNSYNVREIRQQQARGELPVAAVQPPTVRQLAARIPASAKHAASHSPVSERQERPSRKQSSNKAAALPEPARATEPTPAAAARIPAQLAQAGSFAIQMGQYDNDAEASDVKRRLWAMGFPFFQRQESKSNGKTLYMVGAGPYANRREAERNLNSLQEKIKRVEGSVSFPMEIVPYTQ